MSEHTKRMEQFIKEIRKNTSRLSGTEKKLLPATDRSGALFTGVNQEACNFIKGILLAKEARKHSEVYKVHLSGLVDVCVQPELKEEFYYALDEMNQFRATSGLYRRSVRTKSYTPFVEEGVQLLWAYARLKYDQVSLSDVLAGNVPKEIAENVRDETWRYAGMLAAQIDRGNSRTIQEVKDLLSGENNTLMITYELIRGIVMSKDKSLYQALGDFLLAARLQEGVRQAVCETMDAGRTEAFLYLFQVIEDHGLIRYSSVKRAVSTWIGIYDFKSMERMADKLVRLMGACLRDPSFLEQTLWGEDAVGICCALWARAFYDVKEASDTVLRLAESGTKHQMMTASYYLGSFQSRKLSMEAAKKILFEYPEDLELAACYLPCFMGDVYEQFNEIVEYNSSGCSRYWYSPSYDKGRSPRQITPEKLSLSVDEAKHAYALLKELFEKLPKKGLVLDPCIFPWHKVSLSRSDVAIRMCLLAWAMQEEPYLDETANLLPSVNDGRHLAARVLLYRPKTKVRRDILLDCLHSQETNTRNVAFTLVKRLTLTPEDYKKIEGNMKYKKGRKETLDLLKRQEPEALLSCIERLLKEKSEECHMGGLELAQYLKEKKLSEYRLVVPALEAYEHPTKKEQILLTELIGERKKAPDILHTPGYGLYRPDRDWELPNVRVDVSEAERLFVYGEKACIRVLERLDAWIDEHKDTEYEDYMGEEQLLGVRLTCGRSRGGNREAYPLMELWEQFYKEEIKDPQLLMEVYLYEVCLSGRSAYGKHIKLYGDVFGKGDKKEPPFKNMVSRGSYPLQVGTVIDLLFHKYVPKEMKVRWGLVGIAKLYAVQEEKLFSRRAGLPLFDNLVRWLSLADEAEFTDAFALLFRLHKDCRQLSCLDAKGDQTMVEVLRLSDFVRCCVQGIWDKELFYKAAFTFYDMGRILRVVTAAVKSYLGPAKGGTAAWDTCLFFGGQPGDRLTSDDSDPKVQFAFEVYEDLVPKVLDVELRRGEQPTPFSEHMVNICVVLGIPFLIRILHAIGDDTLDRNAYYYGNGADRRRVLSSLLSRCYPRKEETAEDLSRALKGAGISKKRLTELAMYAPQWIPLIETCLKIPGFQSGCYYFMAHTSEWLNDETMAMVAKYTPLTREELQDGAFDIHWFREAYSQLGEKEFKVLYQAAKYTSYGTAHARAKRYADAALGNTDFETLKAKIDDKRNKDLLMSLPLLPFDSDSEKREEELLIRYQYIQQYRKESRQFGAQRRASEARAADMALRNLSMNAGFSDVTRLVLHMETQLTDSYDIYFTWQQAGEMLLRVFVDETGKCSLQCRTDGKIRKAVPAKYKKDPLVTECQTAVKKLKEQHTRTRKMLEESMEDGVLFEIWELLALLKNPVLRPLAEPLVYIMEQSENGRSRMGFLSEQGLTDWSGETGAVTPKTRVRIAHPWDLYRDGHWQEYQKVLFEKQIRQPFKQVFRELYVKLTEELNKRESRLFSGYQIQPKKTVATLRTRRWVADYESGLQKVYYKEDMIAVIYALADWFSPSDIEAPTLESVVFYDRKDFSQKRISEIPDRVYSEVMRDVDLAVSVAYVGGVDPESSHSTVEMRRVIVEGNLKLFGVKNVRLEGNHAVIDGQMGQYTVHLGSGVVHQTGNAMLYILPVHSQHRGKLFLPFVDEDPKTAEVWSKILLLAEDKKIKDPAILAQIR